MSGNCQTSQWLMSALLPGTGLFEHWVVRPPPRFIYEFVEDAENNKELATLPLPSLAHLFLDPEANPYVMDEGLEYLIEIVTFPERSGGEPIYESLWALTRPEEKKAFETSICKVTERWRCNPGLHIYQYAAYEPTAIKSLAGRHDRVRR